MTDEHAGLTRDDEICLRELDHLQAILGRYDQFFFWSKNICLLAVGGGIVLVTEGHFAYGLLWPLPILFGIADISFRRCFWTSKVERVHEIAEHLNGTHMNSTFVYYALRAKTRTSDTVKLYDLLFYAGTLIVVLLLWIAELQLHVLLF